MLNTLMIRNKFSEYQKSQQFLTNFSLTMIIEIWIDSNFRVLEEIENSINNPSIFNNFFDNYDN